LAGETASLLKPSVFGWQISFSSSFVDSKFAQKVGEQKEVTGGKC